MIERITSGSKEFDLALQGGFPVDGITLIGGEAGVGKTTLVHQLLFSNLKPGMQAIYLSVLTEPIQKILKNTQAFSFFNDLVATQCIYYENGGDFLVKEGFKKLLDFVFYSLLQFSPQFYCIDGLLQARALSNSDTEYAKFLYELTGILSTYKCNIFWLGNYTEEAFPASIEASMSDHLIYLSTKVDGKRNAKICKLSQSSFTPGEIEYKITNQGLQFNAALSTAATQSPGR